MILSGQSRTFLWHQNLSRSLLLNGQFGHLRVMFLLIGGHGCGWAGASRGLFRSWCELLTGHSGQLFREKGGPDVLPAALQLDAVALLRDGEDSAQQLVADAQVLEPSERLAAPLEARGLHTWNDTHVEISFQLEMFCKYSVKKRYIFLPQ